LRKRAILVAEDEVLILLGVQGVLEEAGYEVLTAGDGDQARGTLQNHITDVSGFVTDIRLGAGPDGWSLAREARSMRPDLPVIYISGDSAPDWKTEGVASSLMLAKPFTAGQILDAVAQVVDPEDA
jgi:CheY-like chemotaxis protein